jgi:hypothetical protein
MTLYHGTSEQAARQAIVDGLRPRGGAKKGNWKHTVLSNPKCVYLTDVYAPYFSVHATKKGRAAVLEIDTAELDEFELWPDEDFLEQAGRGYDKIAGDMEKRTLLYRKKAHEYVGKWKLSVEHLGTCAHHGVIPPQAIKRVAFWDYSTNSHIAMAVSDPTITLMNHKFCSQKYGAITRWLFGERITPEDYIGYPIPIVDEHRKAIEELLQKRVVEILETGTTKQKLSQRMSL